MENLQDLQEKLLAGIRSAAGLKELDELRVAALGKKGSITEKMKTLGTLPPEEKIAAGKALNLLKSAVENAVESRKSELETIELNRRLAGESIDVTLPVRPETQGRIHPVSKIYEEVVAIFGEMGFEVAEGPDIEDQFHNFNALNMPADHPARQMQDTFYIPNPDSADFDDSYVVRTHTSPVQIRTMEQRKPPIRIIAPGRVYRSDAVDATHSPIFHQIEGLVVDEGITMSDLKGCLETVIKRLYGEDSIVRFRPHHFPFTEPSAEVDVQCFACHGKGCRICKGEGWIEILGCGMVHPKVLAGCGLDPEKYSGFAFGIGLERIVMRRFAVDDMRLFYENDTRFLEQF